MSTGVSYTQLKRLQTMSDEEFSEIVILLFSIVFPESRAALGTVASNAIQAKLLQWLAVILAKARANKIKLGIWLYSVLTGAVGSVGEIANTVKKWLEDLLGVQLAEISSQEIKRALGEKAAEQLKIKLLEKYNVEFPIDNLLSPTIAEELGVFMATVVNDKISLLLNREVEVLSTVFPPDEIAAELDIFITDEINLKLGTSLNGILFNQNLIQELKSQVINRLQQELVNQFAQTKGQLINQYAIEGGDDAALKMQIASQVMQEALAIFSNFQIDGFPINANVYYAQNKKRIHTKMRQREYRRTHVEARHWVHR